MRLDLALIRAHPGLSRRKARDVIEKGQVSVNGETVLEPGSGVDDDSDLVWDPNRKARLELGLRMSPSADRPNSAWAKPDSG